MQSKPMTESEVAKWVGKDKKLEWMPVNPYSTNRNDFGEDEYFSYKMSCHNSLAWENGKITTARGILEYLILKFPDREQMCMMLKELEASQ